MTEDQPPNLRVSDAEREDALAKLGTHMSAGRLDLTEYGERTAKVAAAKTRGELLEVFTDLPEPRPRFGPQPAQPAQPSTPSAPSEQTPYQAPAPQARRPAPPAGQRFAQAMIPLSAVLAVVLFLSVFKVWLIFLLPALVAALVSASRWGDAPGYRRW